MRLLVDGSHIDTKKRGILDMKELQISLVRLLSKPELKDKYKSANGPLEILFY